MMCLFHVRGIDHYCNMRGTQHHLYGTIAYAARTIDWQPRYDYCPHCGVKLPMTLEEVMNHRAYDNYEEE
ncbi:hypothetical protein CMI37_15660 [Candidatus Pacearchaeota archaeon]|nr:hypothetical protein [Candidatus Pacearchaeota archaeon]